MRKLIQTLVILNFFITIPVLASDIFPDWIGLTATAVNVILAIKSGIGDEYGKE